MSNTTEELNPDHVAWTRKLVDSIVIGGMWGVPRDGLIFQKTGENEMTLTDKMPFSPEMAEVAKHGRDVPPTAEALEEYQGRELDLIASHFKAAGLARKFAGRPARALV